MDPSITSKSDADIFVNYQAIKSDAILSLHQEKPSNYSLSTASMVNNIQYETLDVGFLFEINFKIFLKETRDIKVMCISSQHQSIQSKPISILRDIFEQIIERRWIVITYFALRFLMDSILVHYFNYSKPALLSNFLSLCLLYGLLVFYGKVTKTQKYFSDIDSDIRIQSKLKEFYGKVTSVQFNYHDTYTYPDGAEHLETIHKIQDQIHYNYISRRKYIETARHSDRRGESSSDTFSVPVTHHQPDTSIYKSPSSESLNYNHNISPPPQKQQQQQQPYSTSTPSSSSSSSHPSSQKSSDKTSTMSGGKSSSSVGGYFKGFRPRKIIQHAIVLQEDKDRLTKLAFDALQLPLPPSFGYNNNGSENTTTGTTTTSSSSSYAAKPSMASTPSPTRAAYHAPSPSISPSRNNSKPSVITKDGDDGDDSQHIHIDNNNTNTTAQTLAVERHLAQSIVPSSTCPFTGHKASFDPHVFFNFEFVDVEPISRNMYCDRSYAHTFKARGMNYFQDKLKIDPGPAVCKLMLMELYEVNSHKEPEGCKDRHDHIASRGLSKERVQILHSLPGKPFIFVLNFQIPGDPPVSLVAYFALPPDVKERFPGIDTERFLKLLEEYINIPTNETERRALWGLPPTHEAAAAAAAAAGEESSSGSGSGRSQKSQGTKDEYYTNGVDEDDLVEAYDGDDISFTSTTKPTVATGSGGKNNNNNNNNDDEVIIPGARHLDSSAPPTQSNHLRHVDSSAPPTPMKHQLSIQTESSSSSSSTSLLHNTKTTQSANSSPMRSRNQSNTHDTTSHQPLSSRLASSPAIINTTSNNHHTTATPITINKLTNDKKSSLTPTAPVTPVGGGGLWGMKIPVDIIWPDGTEPGTFPPSDFRNTRFKMIPNITDGPWVIKTAVPSKPGILGRKVIVRYFRGEGYMETDVHVGSSVVAAQITGLCRGYGKHFAADLGIMLEPTSENELPERLLACVGINKIDIDIRQKLD